MMQWFFTLSYTVLWAKILPKLIYHFKEKSIQAEANDDIPIPYSPSAPPWNSPMAPYSPTTYGSLNVDPCSPINITVDEPEKQNLEKIKKLEEVNRQV